MKFQLPYSLPVDSSQGNAGKCSSFPGSIGRELSKELQLPGPPVGREFLKPTIWVSPSRVVALGGSVTIRCAGRCPGMEFFLHKAGDPNPQVWTVPDGTVAEFPIPSVGREDGGSYTCDYRSIADQSRSSHPSDPVEIIVGLGGEGGAWLSVPAPSPTPSQILRGSLHQWDAQSQALNVSRRDAGSYSCYYHHKWYPFIWSYPSDPVELVVAGEGPGSVSPIPAPHPAGPSGQRHVQGRKQAQAPRISGSGAQNSSGEQSPAGSTQSDPTPYLYPDCPKPYPHPPRKPHPNSRPPPGSLSLDCPLQNLPAPSPTPWPPYPAQYSVPGRRSRGRSSRLPVRTAGW
uniref:Ig-like domain-containing protein n=1 Tax=Chrysemys picta bellii TaxID=8478 RepID=A0A8C3HTU6_CHRPI